MVVRTSSQSFRSFAEELKSLLFSKIYANSLMKDEWRAVKYARPTDGLLFRASSHCEFRSVKNCGNRLERSRTVFEIDFPIQYTLTCGATGNLYA